MIIGSVQQTD